MANRIIKTNRLLLRPLDMADVEDMTRLIGNFEVSKWLTVVPYPYGLADARQYIGGLTGNWDWAIEIDGAFAGAIRAGDGLGFWLGQPFWGQGYMGEAVYAVVDAWFSAGNEVLSSGYFVGNLPSAAIHQRLGFAKGAIVKQSSRAQARKLELQQLSLSRADWQACHG